MVRPPSLLAGAGVAIAALLSSCSLDDTGGRLSLTVRGEAFPDGQVHVAATRLGTLETVACDSGTVADGAFELPLGDLFVANEVYRVDAFVDVDRNERCDFGVDAVVSLDLAPLTTSSNLTFPDGRARIGDDPTGCASFGGVSYRLTLSDVSENLVYYALVQLDDAGTDPEKVVLTGDTIAVDGEAVIDVEGAGQKGRFYRIDFFEAGSDATCDASTTVHRVSVGAVGVDAAFQCGPPGGRLELEVDLADDGLGLGDCSAFEADR